MRYCLLVTLTALIGCWCQMAQANLVIIKPGFAIAQRHFPCSQRHIYMEISSRCRGKENGYILERTRRGCDFICACQYNRAVCGRQLCKRLTCHEKLRKQQGCCPICVQGCYHTDFGLVKPGSQVSDDQTCRTCSCSAPSVFNCTVLSCLPCKGHRVHDGTCCGRCDLHQCDVNGVSYNNGQEIPSSNVCETCHCVADGTHVEKSCSMRSCHVCEGDWTDDGTCCGRCDLPTTCHVNGAEYKEGEPISSDDPCDTCVCVKNDTTMISECTTVTCPECKGQLVEDGSCCGNCITDVCEHEGEYFRVGVEMPSTDVCEYPCRCEINEDGEPERKCATVACPPCPAGFVRQSGDTQSCCGKCVPLTPDICATVKCAKPACPKQKQHIPEGECCPECKCKYKKELYNPGPFGPKCDGCVCKNGEATCTKPSCPQIECVDPELGDDCCYHCPNGRTCLFGSKLNRKNIIRPQQLKRFGSKLCKCHDQQWHANAFCTLTKYPPFPKSFRQHIAVIELVSSQ